MTERVPPDEEDVLRALVRHADASPGDPAGPCLDADAISAFLSGTLLPAEQGPVERHLARCPACLATVTALARAPGEATPPQIGRLADHARPGRSRRSLAAAAVLLLALGVALFWAASRRHADPDVDPSGIAAALVRQHPTLLADLDLLSLAELAKPPTTIERGGVALYVPLGTELSTRPSFRFARQAGVSTYDLRVRTATGEPLWTVTTPTTEVAYPTDVPPLGRGGRYLWEVTYERLGRQEGRRTFEVATEGHVAAWTAAVDAIDRDAPTAYRALLKAHLAVRRGYWSEARAHAEAAVRDLSGGAFARATRDYVAATLGESDPGPEHR